MRSLPVSYRDRSLSSNWAEGGCFGSKICQLRAARRLVCDLDCSLNHVWSAATRRKQALSEEGTLMRARSVLEWILKRLWSALGSLQGSWSALDGLQVQ